MLYAVMMHPQGKWEAAQRAGTAPKANGCDGGPADDDVVALPDAPSQTGGTSPGTPGTKAQQALQVDFVELPVGQVQPCAACMADMQAQQRDKQVRLLEVLCSMHVGPVDSSSTIAQSTKAQRAEQAAAVPQLANAAAPQLDVGAQFCLVDREWLQEWRQWVTRCDHCRIVVVLLWSCIHIATCM